MTMRDQGLVNQVFDEQKLRALQGDMAIGHVRYSTTGANSWENSQPVWRADRREVALAHNGNLINAVELHAELRERGRRVPLDVGLGDHRRAALDPPGRARSRTRWPTSCRARGRVLDGGDDQGPRRRVPRPGGPAAAVARACSATRYCVASESCAFDIIGAKLLRDVAAGRDRVADRARARRRARPSPATAQRALRVRAHLLRAARLAARRPGRSRSRAGGWARSSRARRRSTPTS